MALGGEPSMRTLNTQEEWMKGTRISTCTMYMCIMSSTAEDMIFRPAS